LLRQLALGLLGWAWGRAIRRLSLSGLSWRGLLGRCWVCGRVVLGWWGRGFGRVGAWAAVWAAGVWRWVKVFVRFGQGV